MTISIVLFSEWPDWFSPLTSIGPWEDRDWSVAVRQPNPPNEILAFTFNSLAFLTLAYTLFFVIWAIFIYGYLAVSLFDYAHNPDTSWIRGNYRLNPTNELPHFRLVKDMMVWYFALMSASCFIALVSALENVYRSVSGLDFGTGTLIVCAVGIGILATGLFISISSVRSDISLAGSHDDQFTDLSWKRPLTISLIVLGFFVVANIGVFVHGAVR